MRNLFASAALGAALALSLAMPASAADPQPDKEIAAAAQHAGFAAGSSDIAGIHTHLHHAVNCLVGPDGEGFAPKELNPCKALGNGAIPDTDDATRKESLEAALERANAGLASEDLVDAKTEAIKTQALLDSLE
ncbi:hypothetical protein [Parvibaculum sp.]|uniref:hypothetical protein n=1 Tax=Parvibaculum sp. TaxID=2024848 RepID=UPI001AFD3DAB|nr:hypothetical protein [Parvibaculum sp.]MBO6635110.1 hypothetical protein [Parvibaculum sp.]MBO6678298.1 hypothetical protein [Parvibaculum sp.]MBO6684645.1 hypothetical protein [Parvibaculum sp.]MBO6906119.1 hypothetical protein [Parvibaculum sp.]